MSLDAAFADADAALMADFGEAAVYTPPDGAPVATRAFVERGVRPRADGHAIENVHVAWLPTLDVPAPLRGGVIAVGATGWVIEAVEFDDGSAVAVRVRPQ